MEGKAIRLLGVFVFVGMGLVLAPRTLFAGAACPSLKQLAVDGTFQWKAAGGAQKLRFRLGKRNLQGGKKTWQAEIVSADTCQAICRVTSVERHGGPRLTALQMNCQNPAFQVLTTPATLILSSGPNSEPVLRFGTWLTGYRESRLNVHLARRMKGFYLR